MDSFVVSPPLRAPYLVGLPSLPAELLRRMKRREALTELEQQRLRLLLQEIRRRRQAFEAEAGVIIQPERPHLT